ncbi:MAG TPA: 4'-phosphopantetheinyl transferase superfamily protein [Longimicrobiales bacterium]
MNTRREAWRPRGAPPPLAEGTVHMWYAPLDADPTAHARLERVITPEERARAARLRDPVAARRFAAARGFLRTLLGAYLDRPADAVRILVDRAGKPRLPSPAPLDVRFNVSHSGGHALVAVARGIEVGVDIECEAPRGPVDRLARRVLAARERRMLERLDGADRLRAFLAIWTRKEALVKAIGCGVFGTPLHALDLGAGEDGGWLVHRDPATGTQWALRSIRPPVPGYTAAVAVQGSPADVRCYRLTGPA